MIACAADEIVADPSSIVGSIGVIGATFGFTKLIEKIGIERRIYTAGTNKAMLDPFLPENPEHVARLKAIQEDIHAAFIDLVKSRRGAKLTAPEDELYSGEYWAARKGIEYGLVDRIGDLRSFLRERYGDKVETPLVSPGRGLFGRTTPGSASSGCSTSPDLPTISSRRWRRAPSGRATDCDTEAAMPPVILWALGAIGAAVIGRWLAKEARRVNAELHPEEHRPRSTSAPRRASSSAIRKPACIGPK